MKQCYVFFILLISLAGCTKPRPDSYPTKYIGTWRLVQVETGGYSLPTVVHDVPAPIHYNMTLAADGDATLTAIEPGVTTTVLHARWKTMNAGSYISFTDKETAYEYGVSVHRDFGSFIATAPA